MGSNAGAATSGVAAGGVAGVWKRSVTWLSTTRLSVPSRAEKVTVSTLVSVTPNAATPESLVTPGTEPSIDSG